MRRWWLATTLTAGLLSAVGLAQDNPISIDTTIQVVCPDGSLIRTSSAPQGAIVRYTLTATNTAEVTLPAGVVQVNSPVPTGMHLVLGSEQEDPTWGKILVEYQQPNGSYGKPPPDPGSLPASQRSDNSYQAVRWTILHTVAPGQSGWLRYEVKIGTPSTPQAWVQGCPGAPPTTGAGGAPGLPPLPSGGLSTDPIVQWVEGIFGEAGIVQTGCPGNPDQTNGIYVCGTTNVDFDLFRMQWDTYAQSAPDAKDFTPASAWRLEKGRYARYFTGPSNRAIVVTFTALNNNANLIVVGATKGN